MDFNRHSTQQLTVTQMVSLSEIFHLFLVSTQRSFFLFATALHIRVVLLCTLPSFICLSIFISVNMRLWVEWPTRSTTNLPSSLASRHLANWNQSRTLNCEQISSTLLHSRWLLHSCTPVFVLRVSMAHSHIQRSHTPLQHMGSHFISPLGERLYWNFSIFATVDSSPQSPRGHLTSTTGSILCRSPKGLSPGGQLRPTGFGDTHVHVCAWESFPRAWRWKDNQLTRRMKPLRNIPMHKKAPR